MSKLSVLRKAMAPIDVTTFVYDPASNLLSAENGVGLVTYSYDPRNLPAIQAVVGELQRHAIGSVDHRHVAVRVVGLSRRADRTAWKA